jgi:hypothetical protein
MTETETKTKTNEPTREEMREAIGTAYSLNVRCPECLQPPGSLCGVWYIRWNQALGTNHDHWRQLPKGDSHWRRVHAAQGVALYLLDAAHSLSLRGES